MNHANKFKVGNTIRAYEFQPCAGRDDSYHEGKVVNECNTAHGYHAYEIEVTRHVFGGEACPESVGERVLVPHQVSFREYAHRIVPV
jgi:hypothetical protein